MSILFWNVRGMGRAKKRNDIKNIIKKSRCKIACFQETKLQNINLNLVRSTYGSTFIEWYCKETRGSSGGLLTTWDSSSVLEPHPTQGISLSPPTSHQLKITATPAPILQNHKQSRVVRCFLHSSKRNTCPAYLKKGKKKGNKIRLKKK